MATPLEPCTDCGTPHEPSPARGTRCKRCHARAYRKGYYSDVVKKSQAKLEAHRAQSRDGMRRIYADPVRNEARLAKRRKGARKCES
jgi:hypothetical protein